MLYIQVQTKDYQEKTQKRVAKEICIRSRRTAAKAIASSIALAVSDASISQAIRCNMMLYQKHFKAQAL